MYSSRSGLILAFHGCDESIAQEVVSQTQYLKQSVNDWDWLGHGSYFWENSPSRALDFARELSKKKDSSIRKPAVLGAVLNLGYCFDLLDYKNLETLRIGYELVKNTFENSGLTLPQNLAPKNSTGSDLLIRKLDCAVLEAIHKLNTDSNLRQFDSVRGVFWEGAPLYPDAGFREKDHIQICIRNPNCIKGFFIPRKLDGKQANV